MTPANDFAALVEAYGMAERDAEEATRDLYVGGDARFQRKLDKRDETKAALLAYGVGVEQDAERWRFSLTLLGAQSPADALLNDANQLLRTCYQVAEREHVKPNSTNWPALRDRIHDALKQQHTHMYPDTTRPTEARES